MGQVFFLGLSMVGGVDVKRTGKNYLSTELSYLSTKKKVAWSDTKSVLKSIVK